MQTYSLISLTLLLTAAFTSRFAWQTPQDNTPRVAVLENTKPPKEEIIALVEEAATVELPSIPETVVPESFAPGAVATEIEEEPGVLAAAAEPEAADDVIFETAPSLPQELNQLEPNAEIEGDTAIGEIRFSTEIADNYEAVNPRRIFAEGFYTLYATFGFEEMVDGLEWSWVWRHNGSVIDGGNELWNYGRQGLGYIYLNPPEGFSGGEYGLEVWVNGEMLSRSAVTMNNAAVSAGN